MRPCLGVGVCCHYLCVKHSGTAQQVPGSELTLWPAAPPQLMLKATVTNLVGKGFGHQCDFPELPQATLVASWNCSAASKMFCVNPCLLSTEVEVHFSASWILSCNQKVKCYLTQNVMFWCTWEKTHPASFKKILTTQFPLRAALASQA